MSDNIRPADFVSRNASARAYVRCPMNPARLRPFLVLGAVFVTHCRGAVQSRDGVDALAEPPRGSGDLCSQSCGSNDGRRSDGDDPIEYLSYGVDDFFGFFESVEAHPWGERMAFCTGVQGIALYRADDPCCLSLEGALHPDPSQAFPRCQHLDSRGDWLFASNRGDEVGPNPFVTVIDAASLTEPKTLARYSDGDTSFEGIAVFGDTLYVAQHDRGLAVLRIGDRGDLNRTRTLTEGLANAWKPVVDETRSLLFVADAQGGLAVYSVEDPQDPRRLANVPTEGTLKDLEVRPPYVYGAAGTAGIEVFDSTVPEATARIARADTPGSALGITSTEDYLVVADWNDVVVFSRADPRSLREVARQKPYARRVDRPAEAGRVLDVAVRDHYVFMAEWGRPQAHLLIPGVEAPELFTRDEIEFERTAPGEVSSTGFFVENRGRTTLQIDSLVVDDPYTAEIRDRRIEPGAASLVSLTFAPTPFSLVEGNLIIRSNDPDEPEKAVRLIANKSGPRRGDPVPDVTFVTLDGFDRRLRDLRGQPVLLAYFATF